MKIILLFLCCSSAFAYESTDNKSMNKFDRIGVIEKYLKGADDLLKQLKQDMEETKLGMSKLKEVDALKMELKRLKEEVELLRLEKGKSDSGGPPKSEGSADATNPSDLKSMDYDQVVKEIKKLKELELDKVKYQVEVHNVQIKTLQSLQKINSDTTTNSAPTFNIR